MTWGVESTPRPGAEDSEETAVLPKPPVRPENENPADRVPDWLFRQEDDRTRELPRVEDDDEGDADRPLRKRRRRPEWADDAPTLADDLLGPRPDEDGGRGRGRQ